MQDYLGLGSEARINTPGTSSLNWRWRVDPEQLNEALFQHVAKLVQSAGRRLTS